MMAEENCPPPHYQMIYFEPSSALAGPCLVYNRIRLLHLIICFGFAPTAKLLIKLSLDLNGSFLHIILRGHARSIFKYIPIKCIKLILADLHTLLIRMFINNLLKITAGDGVDITSNEKKRYSCLQGPQEHTLGDNRYFVINRHTSSFSLPLH